MCGLCPCVCVCKFSDFLRAKTRSCRVFSRVSLLHISETFYLSSGVRRQLLRTQSVINCLELLCLISRVQDGNAISSPHHVLILSVVRRLFRVWFALILLRSNRNLFFVLKFICGDQKRTFLFVLLVRFMRFGFLRCSSGRFCSFSDSCVVWDCSAMINEIKHLKRAWIDKKEWWSGGSKKVDSCALMAAHWVTFFLGCIWTMLNWKLNGILQSILY